MGTSQKSWKRIVERILRYAITAKTGLVSWAMASRGVKRKAMIFHSTWSNEDARDSCNAINYLSELCTKLLLSQMSTTNMVCNEKIDTLSDLNHATTLNICLGLCYMAFEKLVQVVHLISCGHGGSCLQCVWWHNIASSLNGYFDQKITAYTAVI